MDEGKSLQDLLLYAGLGFGGLFLISFVLGVWWLFLRGPGRATGLGSFLRQFIKPDYYKGFLFAETKYGGSFFLTYLVVAAVIGAALYVSGAQYLSIARHYASTTATRVSLTEDSPQGWQSNTRYVAQYSYIVDGQSYKLTDTAGSKTTFPPMKTVAYSSADPATSTLVYRGSFYDDFATGQIIGVALLTSIFLLIWYLNAFFAFRRRRQASRERQARVSVQQPDSINV